jgi:hypothetical protein
MNKYIIGVGMNEFSRIELNEVEGALEESIDEKEVEFVVIVADDDNKKLFEYYSAIETILKNNKDLFLVYIKDTEMWKPLAMLMATYDRYDVYRTEGIDSINSEYIRNIEKRRPTYREESIVHGNDVIAYSKLNIIVLGISNLVAEQDVDGLTKFIRKYANEIDGIVKAFDYMKYVVEQSNKSALERELDEKTNENLKLYDDIAGLEREKKRTSIEMRDLRKELSITSEKLRVAESKVITAEAVNEAGATGNVTDYPELNTIQLNSKIGRVLYFKELSHIPYINSFVWAFIEQLKIYKVKVKLIIYDTDVDMKDVYAPLKVCDSKEFVDNKRYYVEKAEKLIMTEPNPTVITEVARCLPAYEVVVIYDKMKHKKDIITGNGVKKYYVCSGSNSYNAGCKNFGIKKAEEVIALTGCGIGGKYLDIPRIDSYKVCTDNAKISKYMKLTGTLTGESIAKTILEESHIVDIMKQKGMNFETK